MAIGREAKHKLERRFKSKAANYFNLSFLFFSLSWKFFKNFKGAALTGSLWKVRKLFILDMNNEFFWTGWTVLI